MKRSTVFLILCVSILGALPALADTLSGSWSGTVTQSKQSYSVQIQLNDSGNGSADYSTLQCGGTLTFQGQNGTAFTYRESITRGQSKCTDGVTVITPIGENAKQLQWRWTGGGETASGTLTGSGKIAKTSQQCLSAGSMRTTDGQVYWNFRNSCDKELLVTVCAEYANGNNNIRSTNVPARQSADIYIGDSATPHAKLTWKEGGGIPCPSRGR